MYIATSVVIMAMIIKTFVICVSIVKPSLLIVVSHSSSEWGYNYVAFLFRSIHTETKYFLLDIAKAC
jgi:hypothetical protein